MSLTESLSEQSKEAARKWTKPEATEILAECGLIRDSVAHLEEMARYRLSLIDDNILEFPNRDIS